MDIFKKLDKDDKIELVKHFESRVSRPLQITNYTGEICSECCYFIVIHVEDSEKMVRCHKCMRNWCRKCQLNFFESDDEECSGINFFVMSVIRMKRVVVCVMNVNK